MYIGKLVEEMNKDPRLEDEAEADWGIYKPGSSSKKTLSSVNESEEEEKNPFQQSE